MHVHSIHIHKNAGLSPSLGAYMQVVHWLEYTKVHPCTHLAHEVHGHFFLAVLLQGTTAAMFQLAENGLNGTTIGPQGSNIVSRMFSKNSLQYS